MYRIIILVLLYLVIKNIRRNHFMNIQDKDGNLLKDSDDNSLKLSDGSVNPNYLNFYSEVYFNENNNIVHEDITADSIEVNNMMVSDLGSIKSGDDINVSELTTSKITIPKLVVGDDHKLCIGDDVCLTGKDITEIYNMKEYCVYEDANSINKYCITGDDIVALNKYDTDVSVPQGYIKGTYVQRAGLDKTSNNTNTVYYHLYPGNNELYTNSYTPSSYYTCFVSLKINTNYNDLAINPGYRLIGRVKDEIQIIIENTSDYVYHISYDATDGLVGIYNTTDVIPETAIIYKTDSWYTLSSIELQKI